MSITLKIAALGLSGLVLASCGQTAAECAATGGIIGAAAARVTDNDIGDGALLGAVGGLAASQTTYGEGCY